MRARLATMTMLAGALVATAVVAGSFGFGSAKAEAGRLGTFDEAAPRRATQGSRPLMSPAPDMTRRRTALRRARNAARTYRSFRLLAFTGAPMKWGDTRFGRPAVIRWRLAKREERFANARNCRAIGPVAAALTPHGLDTAGFRVELAQAMKAWEDVAGLRFEEANGAQKADLVLGAQLKPRGRAYTNVSTIRMSADEDRRVDRLVNSIICLNPRRPWKIGFDGNLKRYDLRHTLTHELGHVIGLDHSGARGSVMAFRYDESVPGLTPGDIMGAQRLYGLPDFLRQAGKR